MFWVPCPEVTVIWYAPYGHGQGSACQAVEIESNAGVDERAEGGIQNAPDRMALLEGFGETWMNGGRVGAEDGVARSAGSGVTSTPGM